MRIAVLVALAGAMLALPAPAFGKSGFLLATVDDGAIALRTPDGKPVTDLHATIYFIDVDDRSAVNNFHLIGPGVDRSTESGSVGTVRWVVSFGWKERYRYVSDADPLATRGTFTTEGGPPLVATVGPAGSISLRTDLGRPVTRLAAGRHWIVVRDLSRRRSFDLRGPSVNRSTSAAFRGEVAWIVTLRRGRYRYGFDLRMRTFRVT
jgi:hypothetical protein